MPLLTVATANVLHGIALESGRVDLDAHARALARLDADVIAVQEVDRGLARSGGADQVAELAERLGYEGVFAPALLGDPDRRWRTVEHGADGPAYGVGLLSRHELSDVRRVALPGGGDGERAAPTAARRRPPSPGWDREPRVALSATVSVGGVGVGVLTTHLSYLPWRGLQQLRRVLDLPGERRGLSVLGGDLNLPVSVVRALASGWTHAGGQPTYPAWRPRLQPDQVMTGQGLLVRRLVIGTGPGDHLPLVATLELRG